MMKIFDGYNELFEARRCIESGKYTYPEIYLSRVRDLLRALPVSREQYFLEQEFFKVNELYQSRVMPEWFIG